MRWNVQHRGQGFVQHVVMAIGFRKDIDHGGSEINILYFTPKQGMPA